MSTELLRVKNKHRRRALPAGIVILSVLQSKLGMPLTIAKGGMREGVLLCMSGLASTWVPLTAQQVSAPRSSVATVSEAESFRAGGLGKPRRRIVGPRDQLRPVSPATPTEAVPVPARSFLLLHST